MGRLASLVSLTALALAAAAAPVSAQYRPSDHYFGELFAGWNETAPELLDPGVTFGFRIGHVVENRWGFMVSGSSYSSDVPPPEPGLQVEYDHFPLDVSGLYNFSPEAGVGSWLVAGLGYAWGSVTGIGEIAEELPVVLDRLDGGSFTVHAGFGLEVPVGSQSYLRPEVRARWYEARDSDPTDLEATLAFGLRF